MLINKLNHYINIGGIKMYKRWLTAFLIILSALLIVGCSSSESDEGNVADNSDSNKAIKVKFGHTLTEDSNWHQGALHFADLIKDQTNGRYEVEIFPNGQISSGNQQKAIEMLRQGSYDVDITSALIWSDFDSDLGITSLPWILPTLESAEEVIHGKGGEMLLDILNDNGVRGVAIGETGYRQMLTNKRQIESPADLANLKIRVPGTPLFLDLYKELGADPIAMDFTEVFTSLQQGTIDGMEGVVDVMVTNRFYEVLDYMSVNNYNFDFFFFTFSNDFYDSLSDEDKEIFMEAGKESTEFATNYAREANEEALEFLRDELEVFEPSEKELDEFKKAASPIYEQYKDDFNPELRKAFNYLE